MKAQTIITLLTAQVSKKTQPYPKCYDRSENHVINVCEAAPREVQPIKGLFGCRITQVFQKPDSPI